MAFGPGLTVEMALLQAQQASHQSQYEATAISLVA
jgi:hypothetical protein